MIFIKERIYTIPITDALNDGCGCILCTLEKKLEEDAVTYFLGPSLMEPDNRKDTNKNGFCRRHINMLCSGKNTLGLALMLETHIDELSKSFVLNEKKGVFSKKHDVKSTADSVYKQVQNCSLCNKVNMQMEIAAQNLVYLLDTEKDFSERFFSESGLCFEHFALALSSCEKELGLRAEKTAIMLCDMQREYLNELRENLHSFTKSFDYRSNGEKPSDKIVASVSEAIKYLGKF